MPKRAYVSSVRSAAAAEKRDRIIEAATKALREDVSIARFSLDTVAKAAGVTPSRRWPASCGSPTGSSSPAGATTCRP